MSTDVLQDELTSCLTEVEKVEKEVDAQLQLLGEEVDAGFSQMKELNNAFADVAAKVVNNQYNPRLAGGLMVAGVALSSVLGAYGYVKAAKAHNKALNQLLQTKRKIATAKIESTKRISKRVEHVIGRLKKLVDNEAIGSYEIESLDENILKGKLSVMDKTMAVYRTSLYNKLLVDYLIAEYHAWMNGNQRSQMERPTYYDCNLKIAESLSINKEHLEKDISPLFQYNDNRVYGDDIYKAHDPQIFSVMLLEYGFNGNRMKSLPTPNESILGKAVRKNISYKIYKHALRRQSLADFFSGGMILFILIAIFLFLDYSLFHWLDWAGWIEWTLGILFAIVGCVAILAGSDAFEELHKSWIENIYTKAIQKLLKVAGYVEIYQPDLKKKNVVWAGVKGFGQGLMSVFD